MKPFFKEPDDGRKYLVSVIVEGEKFDLYAEPNPANLTECPMLVIRFGDGEKEWHGSYHGGDELRKMRRASILHEGPRRSQIFSIVDGLLEALADQNPKGTGGFSAN